MDRGQLRKTLLTTSSALALIVGVQRTAAAAVVCTFSNQAGGVNNTGAINCITYNNEQGGTANGNFTGATSFTGNVVNTGTITPTGINQNWPAGLAGTDAGISVIGPGVTLIGNITNSGTITGTNSQYAGINIGGGGGGSGAPGATVVGSITNAASITGIQQGIFVSGVGTVVTGSVINAAGASIINSPTAGGPGLSVSNHASLAGSLINSGTINTGGTGLLESNATVGGNPVTLSVGTAMVETLGSFLDRTGWDRRTTGKNGHNSAHLLKLLLYATRNLTPHLIFVRLHPHDIQSWYLTELLRNPRCDELAELGINA